MSALGQKQTLPHVRVMSALPPKADIDGASWNVRFVPIVSTGLSLLNEGPEAWALRAAVRGILGPLMEKWPPSSGAAIVWKFSLRSLPAAGLRTQRQSLAPLATEER